MKANMMMNSGVGILYDIDRLVTSNNEWFYKIQTWNKDSEWLKSNANYSDKEIVLVKLLFLLFKAIFTK
jgi:hypothetical protein